MKIPDQKLSNMAKILFVVVFVLFISFAFNLYSLIKEVNRCGKVISDTFVADIKNENSALDKNYYFDYSGSDIYVDVRGIIMADIIYDEDERSIITIYSTSNKPLKIFMNKKDEEYLGFILGRKIK